MTGVGAGRRLATAATLLCVAAVAGCGFGAGPTSPGIATLTVTRDYGTRTLAQASDSDPPASETVIRLLDDNADITTRYGGGFVQSIDGLSGTEAGGRRYDWFFYVNGIESPVGSADVRVKGGDRIWWDYRDWTSAMSVPAVVGSWPEPFAQASSANPKPVRIECLDARGVCATAAGRLAQVGVRPAIQRGEGDKGGTGAAIRLVVGPWRAVRHDPAVDELRGAPASTGVFATYKGPVAGQFHLIGLNAQGKPARDLGPRAGLVAALRQGDDPPTWIATGSRETAVRSAVRLLDAGSLRDHYAVAAADNHVVSLPIIQGEEPSS